MTKAELVGIIAKRTGVERNAVLVTIEAFMEEVKNSLEKGEDVHLRGFGSFVVKHRAQKTGRILSKNTTIIIPAHDVPAFKPADTFVERVKDRPKQG
ncbi:MAG: integration host factor subunit beta [Flavobacteriales bacterium]|nr:integration host factor subunit beta [Flavobacteriales bacterium]